LREAIREEEEASAAERGNGAGFPVHGKVRKGKMVIKGRDGEEKVDGRAGPRSENIVLSKSRCPAFFIHYSAQYIFFSVIQPSTT
jgi:hypothetical protein